MKPSHGQRSVLNKVKQDKVPSAARQFVETNTHHNITMKREFVFIEDVRHAININSLEERLNLKRWIMAMLLKRLNKDELVRLLDASSEKDRHRLQKEYRITL